MPTDNAPHPMSEPITAEELTALSKAASALRFRANNAEDITDAARRELLAIASGLATVEARLLGAAEEAQRLREELQNDSWFKLLTEEVARLRKENARLTQDRDEWRQAAHDGLVVIRREDQKSRAEKDRLQAELDCLRNPVLVTPTGEVPLAEMDLSRLAYEYRNTHDKATLGAIAAELEKRQKQLDRLKLDVPRLASELAGIGGFMEGVAIGMGYWQGTDHVAEFAKERAIEGLQQHAAKCRQLADDGVSGG